MNLLNFDQAARAKFLSPVNFLSTEIKVPANDALHAYKPLLPAVKTVQPHVVICLSLFFFRQRRRKDNTNNENCKIKNEK